MNKKNTAILVLFALLSKLIGFIKEAVIAYYFGTSSVVDAFSLADSIVVIFSGWIVAVATVYIPSYIQIKKTDGQENADCFTNSIIKTALVVATIFIIIVVLFRKQVAFLFAPSASAGMRNWLEIFLVTDMVSTLALVIYRIVRSNMDSRGKFTVGGVVDTIISLTMLGVVILAGISNAKLLAFTSIIGYGIAAIIYIVFLAKYENKINVFGKIHPAVKTTILSAVPILINSLIVDVMSTTDKVFGAALPEGTVAMLTYASMLESAVFQIIGTPILTVIYPNMSRSVLEKDKKPFRSIYEQAVKNIIMLFIPISIAVILLSSNIISIIYQRGNFDSNATYYTSLLLKIYICGAVVATLSGLISRFLISINYSKTVLAAGIFSAVLNILLDALFIKPLGANGLALASVVASISGIPVCLWKVKDWINEEVHRDVLPTIIKCVIGAAAMSLYVLFIKDIITGLKFGIMIQDLLILVLSAAGGIPIYFSLLYLMKVDEVKTVFAHIKRKISHGGKNNV